MPDITDRVTSCAQLRERLDELATQVVLEGVSDDLAAALADLSARAGTQGFPRSALVASELADQLGGTTVSTPAASLNSEIGRLQQALDDEDREQRSLIAAEPAIVVPNALAQDPELVGDFVLESREHLAAIESRILTLEQDPGDMEAVHSVFRGFHTIKGLAGFLEFSDIQAVSHEVETLLALARNATLTITPSVVDVVLSGADYLKQAISGVEAALAGVPFSKVEGAPELIARIREAQSVESKPPSSARAENRPEVAVAVTNAASPPVVPPVGGPSAIAQSATLVEPEPETSCVAGMSVIEAAFAGTAQQPTPTGAASAAAGTPPKDAPNTKSADTVSVRVETGKLDYLMDMVGEMVIAQSLIRNNPSMAAVQDSRLQRDLSQLARITGEVRRTAMGMRMIPIGRLFQKTARLVRDLSRKAGKLVELETRGEETELDKTIAEQLADPLLHMVRNAIDHGIELPEERASAGKHAAAQVRLAAYHQGGQIVVSIADDGRGLDQEKILQKARQSGLIADGAQPSENEIFHLIFEPGFSTADRVTDISGRGVGMDVVRKHVQKLRGRIDIQSRPGQGTTFYLKLPLTLAIIEGLIVLVGDHRYIVPIFAVKEMFRPGPDAVSTVEGRDEMVLVRGRLLPVVRLYRRFGVRPRTENPSEGLLIVAECDGRPYAMLVDDLAGKQEVVIKSLGESLKNIAGIAGGAILGDGRVGLILDMEGVFCGAHHG